MRLIDANALPHYDGTALSAVEVARAVIYAPTIEERKKGKWMTKSTFMPDHYGGYYIDQYVCTNCESEFFKPSKFCPNCGADNRKEKANE